MAKMTKVVIVGDIKIRLTYTRISSFPYAEAKDGNTKNRYESLCHFLRKSQNSLISSKPMNIEDMSEFAEKEAVRLIGRKRLLKYALEFFQLHRPTLNKLY